MSCPDDDDGLGVGCCEAVGGWTAKKLVYNGHGHPTAPHQTGAPAHPLPMAQMELNIPCCCNVFQLVHLVSKHQEYGGEQLKIASSNVPEKKMFSCALLAAAAVMKQNISHQQLLALEPGLRCCLLE